MGNYRSRNLVNQTLDSLSAAFLMTIYLKYDAWFDASDI